MTLLQPFLLALSFFTRLPVPKRLQPELTLADSAWAFPLVGAVTGLLGGLVFIALLAVGVTHNIAAWMTLAFLILLTGGLHEDGLADMADGLAYARSREEKLSIMRDSRIGSYGVIALVVMLAIRAQAMAMFLGNVHTLLAFAAAGACSRAVLAALMYARASARSDGLAARAGKPAMASVVIALLIGFLLLLCAAPVGKCLGVVLVLAGLGIGIAHVARSHFGGITGDVLGALQQVSEATVLVLLG